MIREATSTQWFMLKAVREISLSHPSQAPSLTPATPSPCSYRMSLVLHYYFTINSLGHPRLLLHPSPSPTFNHH